ncbi:MAG: hypothetical protein AB1593_05480 [Pseudomonadota bacterium]
MHTPFPDAPALERLFAEGLDAMLSAHQSLGVYILVLANAAYDTALWTRLAPALARRHAELADRVTATLRHGDAVPEPDDDLMVFLKLNTIGFSYLGRTEIRYEGPWHLLFNPLRALRPPRASGQTFEGLLRPFDPSGFHFNKAFLAREVLWSGELDGRPVRLLYNKFPFARLHGLLVPEPERCLPQMLTPQLHDWAWTLCARTGVDGFCLGYNSVGAGASVNHLHFQSFVQTGPLPVEDAGFIHNGGEVPYPLPCLRLDDCESAWQALERMHRAEQPYNLIYARHALYCIARKPQDAPQLDAVIRGYGWSEMAGFVTRFNRPDFIALTPAQFESELARFCP